MQSDDSESDEVGFQPSCPSSVVIAGVEELSLPNTPDLYVSSRRLSFSFYRHHVVMSPTQPSPFLAAPDDAKLHIRMVVYMAGWTKMHAWSSS